MITVVDNYDSFTYNLVQQIERLAGARVRVVRNDAFTPRALLATRPAAIHASASRREARPARAITFAMRSPGTCFPEVSAIGRLRHAGTCPGYPRLLCRSVYKGVEARHKAGHGNIHG